MEKFKIGDKVVTKYCETDKFVDYEMRKFDSKEGIIKNIDPPETDEIYRKAEISIYRQFAPRVNECGHCGWPYPEGYICSYCGFDNSEYDDRE